MDPRNQPLTDLHYPLWLTLRQCLDENNQWERLAQSYGRYSKRAIEEFRNAVCRQGAHSPADALLLDLNAKGVTVGGIAEKLNHLRLEEPLLLFRNRDHIVFVQHPHPLLTTIYEGPNNCLTLHCEAEGFPYPRYQWYKTSDIYSRDFKAIESQRTATLKISPVRYLDSGKYFCVAYHIYEERMYSEKSAVAHVDVLVDQCPPPPFEPSLPELPVIELQPVAPAALVNQGLSFDLELTAVCRFPLKYQWFRDGVEIPDATASVLKIVRLTPDNEKIRWDYQCEVSSERGKKVLSDVVHICLDVALDTTQYTAEDKVALLIGNSRYQYLPQLHAPVLDVQTLSEALTSLGFKVIALCNLTRQEMEKSIKMFSNLLEKGVYACFYYAGHGFEILKEGCMLPVDAPIDYRAQDIINISFVHKEIQTLDPALCLIILDMCRREPELTADIRLEELEQHIPTVHRNTLLVYATSSTCAAFELQNAQNGIFMQYLKDVVLENIPVRDVMNKVKIHVSRDERAGLVQFPSTEDNMTLPRKLSDTIQSTTTKSEMRQSFFRHLKELPRDISISYKLRDESISVCAKCYKLGHAVQNVLRIVFQVTRTLGDESRFKACISVINQEVTLEEVKLRHAKPGQTIFDISGLQKLQDSLTVKLLIKDTLLNGPAIPIETLDFQRPMVSSLIGIDR